MSFEALSLDAVSLDALLLLAAATGLVAALTTGREGVVVLAVAGYTALLLWLMRADMALLPPALGIAIALGVVAVGRRLRREWGAPADPGDHDRHRTTPIATTRRSC